MKQPAYTMILLGAILIALFSGCDPERKLSEEEKILVGPNWKMNDALIDGQPDSTDFEAFRLTFLAKGKWKSTESDNSERSGSWVYDEVKTTLTTVDNGSGLLAEYFVVLLDQANLQLQFRVAGRDLEWRMVPE
mgnify:CR=1 FL=1